MAANTVSLKLLVDSTNQRVLFAESGKDFVDFLFNILSLPVAIVIRLLTKENMVGSLGNLYDSLDIMNDTVVNPKKKDSSSAEGGYVKGFITYIIMDDLVVRPMSAISCITLLKEFNIKNFGLLEEKTVDIGIDEVVKLLKASSQSKTVLTDVFLEKKAAESDTTNWFSAFYPKCLFPDC